MNTDREFLCWRLLQDSNDLAQMKGLSGDERDWLETAMGNIGSVLGHRSTATEPQSADDSSSVRKNAA